MLAKHGTVRPQPPSDWTGTIQLPECVGRFYEEVGPGDVTINARGNPFFLPSLAALWEYQTGYRWDASGKPSKYWNDDWLVIGSDQCEAAFILSRTSGRILHELHGCGTWRPVEIFSDLNTMAACLATLGTLVAVAGKRFTADDCTIRPEQVERAVERLRRFLPSKETARSVIVRIGWI